MSRFFIEDNLLMTIPSKKDILLYIKAQGSSLVASAIDFGVFNLCDVFLKHYDLVPADTSVVISNMAGNISGGIVNFYTNRNLVFSGANKEASRKQGIKYACVWLGNLLLNAGGIYCLHEIFKIEKNISKLIVSLILGLTYNYFLQKNFVFKTTAQEDAL